MYIADDFGRKIVETNQYAVTEQSHPAGHSQGQEVPGPYVKYTNPGIFFKYDVEPIQLTIWHTHISTYKFLMRLVALVGGVIAITEWGYKGFDALSQRWDNGGRKNSFSDGLLNGHLEKAS